MDQDQDNAKEAFVTLNKMVSRLSLRHLENELQVLSRLLYRGKSQHRKETGFQKMTKVCKEVKRCVDEDVFLIVKQLSQRHEERASELRPHLFQVAKKLVQNASFVEQLLKFMEKTSIDLLQQLNMNLFVPYNLVMSAILGKLWFSLKLHLTAVSETHYHLQLLGELYGEHTLPQLSASLSAAAAAAAAPTVLSAAPTNNATVSLSKDLLALRMKDFARPSVTKQPLAIETVTKLDTGILSTKQPLSIETKQDTPILSQPMAIINTKQHHTLANPTSSTQVPLHHNQPATHQQAQPSQLKQEQLHRHRNASGVVVVSCKDRKMFRARVKNRRLLNQLKKKTQLRAILKSFRRYQTPWRDRYCTVLLRRYSNWKRRSLDKQSQTQTGLQKKTAKSGGNDIDDLFSVLEN